MGSALTVTGNGIGVGLIESTSDTLLKYTIWDGTTWSQLVSLGPTVYTRAQPTISGSAGTTTGQSIYLGGSTDNLYSETYNSLWTFDGAVGTPQITSKVPGAIVATGSSGATLAYVDEAAANKIAFIDRTSGTWSTPVYLGSETANTNFQPMLAALPSSGDLIAVWQGGCTGWCSTNCTPKNASAAQYRYATRVGGAWSAPADIQYSCGSDPVALVALANGSMLLAWRAGDFSSPILAYRTYDPANSWSNPLYSTLTLLGAPALARGLGTSFAEVAFVGTDYNAYHCSLVSISSATNGCLGAGGGGPNNIGGNVSFVSLATAP
jgi:hypothetical protein